MTIAARTSEPSTEWQPGDPLFLPGSYTNYLFNFRDDRETELCGCNDAASWPEPQPSHDLDRYDALAIAIRSSRATIPPMTGV